MSAWTTPGSNLKYWLKIERSSECEDALSKGHKPLTHHNDHTRRMCTKIVQNGQEICCIQFHPKKQGKVISLPANVLSPLSSVRESMIQRVMAFSFQVTFRSGCALITRTFKWSNLIFHVASCCEIATSSSVCVQLKITQSLKESLLNLKKKKYNNTE